MSWWSGYLFCASLWRYEVSSTSRCRMYWQLLRLQCCFCEAWQSCGLQSTKQLFQTCKTRIWKRFCSILCTRMRNAIHSQMTFQMSIQMRKSAAKDWNAALLVSPNIRMALYPYRVSMEIAKVVAQNAKAMPCHPFPSKRYTYLSFASQLRRFLCSVPWIFL